MSQARRTVEHKELKKIFKGRHAEMVKSGKCNSPTEDLRFVNVLEKVQRVKREREE